MSLENNIDIVEAEVKFIGLDYHEKYVTCKETWTGIRKRANKMEWYSIEGVYGNSTEIKTNEKNTYEGTIEGTQFKIDINFGFGFIYYEDYDKNDYNAMMNLEITDERKTETQNKSRITSIELKFFNDRDRVILDSSWQFPQEGIFDAYLWD